MSETAVCKTMQKEAWSRKEDFLRHYIGSHNEKQNIQIIISFWIRYRRCCRKEIREKNLSAADHLCRRQKGS